MSGFDHIEKALGAEPAKPLTGEGIPKNAIDRKSVV